MYNAYLLFIWLSLSTGDSVLCTAMAVGFLGRRPDANTGHGNELWYGYQGQHNKEEKCSHELLDNAHKGKKVNKSVP